MDYVKIPQNVQIEDKLIGPLSIRQIALIAVGGGTSYALFSGLQKTYGAVPGIAHAFIWLPAIIFIAFAVVKIHDISLFRYVLLILETLSKPRRRVWRPRSGISIEIESPIALAKYEKQKQKEAQSKEKNKEAHEKKSDIRIEELSTILDRGSDSAKRPNALEAESDDNEMAALLLPEKDEQDTAEHRKRLDALWQSMKTGSSSPQSK